MEQSSFLRRWKAFYFKLEDGFLARFEKESHVGSGKKKAGVTMHDFPSDTIGNTRKSCREGYTRVLHVSHSHRRALL